MATEFDKPSKLEVIWADNGDILDPGDTKYETGWGVEIPPRQWENYIQNKQDAFIAHANQHGTPVWDATSQYLALKSYVQGTNTGAIYRAKLDSIGQDPELDVTNTYWDIAFASSGDFYTKAESDSTFLKISNNLSEVNAVTARTNLDVYSKSETYTKTEVDAKTTVASTSQSQAWSSNTVLITPLRLAEAFKGSNQSLTPNGFQKLPGGLIRQWGIQTGLGTNTTGSITLPITFPTAIVGVKFADLNVGTGGIDLGTGYTSVTTSTINYSKDAARTQFYWEAIGY